MITKSRVHLYKPIQIAEILHRDRVCKDINLLDLQSYRNASKKWRDDMSLALLGRVCTSSAKFQDDIFSAMPPPLLNELGKINRHTNGSVEAYIYSRFTAKHTQLKNALFSTLVDTLKMRVGVTNAADRGLDMYSNWIAKAEFRALLRKVRGKYADMMGDMPSPSPLN